MMPLAQQYCDTLKRNLSEHVPPYQGRNLAPAEIIIADAPTIISTLLGSCVAVTMYCRTKKIGAMCHALLPACKPNICICSKHQNKFRSIECSIKETGVST